jgi:hypothetical protein
MTVLFTYRKICITVLFAYRKNSSTTHALVKLLHDWTSQLDNPTVNHIDVMFLDMSKAFDRLNPAVLSCKLLDLGVSKELTTLVTSYLRDRTQQVAVGHVLSEEASVSVGIPQGSRLGPLLWLIYIDDLSPSCGIVKYADDCTIYTPQYRRTVSSKQLQDAADEVDTWCTNNNMLLNVNKSMTMMVKPANNRLKPTYSDVRLNDSVLKNVTDARVLGVILDESLTFKHHVQHVLSKANTKLHVLKILSSHGVDSRNKLKFYKACILPSLLYAIEAWYGFTTEADRKRLDSFQNLGLKLVYCDTQST